MKNNKNLIIAIIAVLVVIIGVVLYVFVFGSNSKNTEAKPQEEIVEVIPTIMPDELGLEFTSGKFGKTVMLEIAKTEDLTLVEYTLSYLDKDGIERGAFGQLDLKLNPAKKEITLGTCSDVCHYDEGVTSVKLVLKVVKKDGKTYQLEKTLNLE